MNRFAASIMTTLSRFGKKPPILVSDRQNETNFGNAEVIFVLDEVRLKFIDDRGLHMIEIELPAEDAVSGDHVLPLETVAVALNWIRLDALLAHYGLNDAAFRSFRGDDLPPGPFYKLSDALAILKDKWGDLLTVRDNADVRRRAVDVNVKLRKRWQEALTLPTTRLPVESEIDPARLSPLVGVSQSKKNIGGLAKIAANDRVAARDAPVFEQESLSSSATAAPTVGLRSEPKKIRRQMPAEKKRVPSERMTKSVEERRMETGLQKSGERMSSKKGKTMSKRITNYRGLRTKKTGQQPEAEKGEALVRRRTEEDPEVP